jgi:nucleoside-diphosphate-sugar epimerase
MLETARARKEFGFAASTRFEEGLAKTIEWYEKFAASRKPEP